MPLSPEVVQSDPFSFAENHVYAGLCLPLSQEWNAIRMNIDFRIKVLWKEMLMMVIYQDRSCPRYCVDAKSCEFLKEDSKEIVVGQ